MLRCSTWCLIAVHLIRIASHRSRAHCLLIGIANLFWLNSVAHQTHSANNQLSRITWKIAFVILLCWAVIIFVLYSVRCNHEWVFIIMHVRLVVEFPIWLLISLLCILSTVYFNAKTKDRRKKHNFVLLVMLSMMVLFRCFAFQCDPMP